MPDLNAFYHKKEDSVPLILRTSATKGKPETGLKLFGDGLALCTTSFKAHRLTIGYPTYLLDGLGLT